MVVFKTLTLKIHNPSKAKQLVMDAAMNRYAMALQWLLDAAWERVEALSTQYLEKGRMALGNGFLTPERLKCLNQFHVQPFKDSLKIEFLNLFESYLKRRLEDKACRYPSVYFDSMSLIKSLENRNCTEKKSLSKNSFNKLFEKYESAKSVYFCRYSDNRDFCLLYDPYRRKFFAKLYLLNQKDALKRVPQKREEAFLAVVGKNALLSASQRPERFIIVPLSFGKPQNDILLTALEKPGMLKTARLIKKGVDYYLSVSVAVEAAPVCPIKGFAGFCVTEKGQMRYTVCSLEGDRLEEGVMDACELDGSLCRLHALANKMVQVCQRYDAQAVLESCSHYTRLAQLMDYKLQLSGLTGTIRVSPFGLWQTCPRCGYNGRNNNLMCHLFMCTRCGLAQEKHLLPSHNLAKRLIKYKNEKVRFTLEYGPHQSRIIKNNLLGIDYILAHKKSIEDFFDYVHHRTRKVESQLGHFPTTWTKEQKKLYSLWKKLLSAKDTREVIEIEAF